MLRSTIRGAALLPLILVSCSPALDSPTQPYGGSEVFVQPALIPSAADGTALPITRIRTVTTEADAGTLLSEDVQEVSPTADEWEITVTLPGHTEVTVVVLLYLIHVDENGSELVQFSGRTDPILVRAGEPVTPDIPIVRGPLANLNTTAVVVSSAPAILREGESATLQASAETSGGPAPEVFWASLDPSIISMAGAQASALAIGTARVVASAGAFADTVLIEVLTSDVTPPTIVDQSPVPGAVGVSAAAPVVVTFSESIDPATVSDATVSLRGPQGAQIASTVSAAGAVVTLTPDAALDSLTTYTVTVGAVADLVGNVFPDQATWSFTTASSAVLLSSFNPGLSTLVSVAFEPMAEQLYIYNAFGDSILVFTTAGARIGGGLPIPGINSNDIDIGFLEAEMMLGASLLPTGTLLVNNGEATPGDLYGVDPATGVSLDSLALQTSGQPVGGAFHATRGTYFSVSWDNDVIHEVDLATGTAIVTFSPAPVGGPPFAIHYGDLEVDPASGNLVIVSSIQNTVRVLSPDGEFIRDTDVGAIGITGMSGVALDVVNRVAWITTTTGVVFAVAGVF